MLVKFSYHPAVKREVNDACCWYDERKEGLGNEFFQEFERALAKIAANPQAFPLAPFGRRKAPLKRFSYNISYRVLSIRIRILSVHHDKRHPSYSDGRW